ncbi:endonuclease/exonuclease/phosphatase family metal-dependent hydrolase [Friedmanniella endophytica]|uniref:Endonuclease/exonuclease/phosphatase family metal-dependent hydrolase n=1 Tax=Microlunatus kandeliicorticis TaxID=1759536 RepID=A0A7W3ITK3_9ACTN|nr:endonuclease/exonuclease/phosphatase family protein [Microlunatus kandeliicorticis]MBA8795009.1 endonuclease/exonuclease/phosphatase family metal-dependent hydrolase [Microlunatus kandeliicorticis]
MSTLRSVRRPVFPRRPALALVGGTALLGTVAAGLIGAAPAQAVAWPDKITNVSIVSSSPGTFTVRWSQSGKNTTGYRLETGLNPFSKTNSQMPYTGRHSHVFLIDKNARSFTFSASQLAAAGAPFGSGNQVYFRLSALNNTRTGTQARNWAYLQAGIPQAPSYRGETVRIGTFNVRTATGAGRAWPSRVVDVAKQLRYYNAEVYALQELNVGRADGKSGSLNGTQRQTQSLVSQLKRTGAGKYRLVRTTPYVSPDAKVNTQGERILYDSTRIRLLSNCPDTQPRHGWNSSCSIRLPIRSNDPSTMTRFAGYAKFQDKTTGKQFWFVSVHLDDRHTGSAANQRSLNALRGAQIAKVQSVINGLNTQHLPVIIAGDYNAWQNDRAGDASHDALVSAGYTDSYAASKVVRGQYATFNDFATTVKPGVNNFGTRLDKIMFRGFTGSATWNNVVKVTDTRRASDHNLVVSDLVY